MKKEIFKDYADIKNQIKELTLKAKEIEKDVTTEMNTQDIDKVESDLGTFFFTSRKKWSYSDALKPLQDEVEEKSLVLKDARKKEEEEGVATFEESKSLTFRSK